LVTLVKTRVEDKTLDRGLSNYVLMYLEVFGRLRH
jgi:hypothetical protein